MGFYKIMNCVERINTKKSVFFSATNIRTLDHRMKLMRIWFRIDKKKSTFMQCIIQFMYLKTIAPISLIDNTNSS